METGKRFTVTSLLETCTSCAIYFNSALALKKHMVSEQHMKCVWTLDPVDGVVGNPSNIVTLGGGKPAPSEEPSLDVLKRMKDANEVIEVSENEDEDDGEVLSAEYRENSQYFKNMNKHFNMSAEFSIMNGRYTLRF